LNGIIAGAVSDEAQDLMRRRLPDLLIIALLFLLPLIMFWQQTIGGQTLIPTENLFQFEPFATYREVARAPAVPHNALVSDLVLENYQWKWFIRESIAQGEIPLWNPYQFSGIPFLAAGQQSTLYPFSVLYYVLPLTAAYGWFTVVQLWLAGAFMYLFVRGLGVGRFGAAISGVTYQLSAFFVISAVFPMIIAAAVWLPLLLLMIENVIGQRSIRQNGQPSTVLWIAIGAIALGCNILAGHVEITYYTLLIMAYYAAARLLSVWWTDRHELPLKHLLVRGLWLAVMVTLGVGLGAIQFIPLFEAASSNFREGSATYQQVIDWAHPKRDVIQFLMPNFYGSPAHHSYVDVFTWQTIPATVNALGQTINTIDWGIKNYVEGALYLGILPLGLAVFALLNVFWRLRRPHSESSPFTRGFSGLAAYHVIFGLLVLLGLTFMFGLPTYAILYYGLPGINQLHSPFRWIFAVTLGVAVLAGFGANALTHVHTQKWRGRIGIILMLLGAAMVIGIRLSVFIYPQIEPLIDRIFNALAKAPEAFADARMFFSYQYTNVITFGVFVFAAGLVFWLFRRYSSYIVQGLAVGIVALDLMVASWGFNPASDPGLLDFTPPAIQWLQQQPGYWRYTTLDDPAQRPIMNANVGWRYKLYDVRGYESIIPKQYVEYMQHFAPQVQLEFNRVAPLYTNADYYPIGDYHMALDSPMFDLLNIRYVITHKNVGVYFQEWKLAYEDEAVRIWENDSLVPRAYAVAPDDISLTSDLEWLAIPRKPMRIPSDFTPATIMNDSGREKLIEVIVDEPSMLVVSETHLPGWRAYRQTAEGEETPLQIQRVQGNFQGVSLDAPGDYTIRLVYSPTSFQVGAFASFVSAVLLALMVGIWLWQLLFAARSDSEVSGVSRVARNSLAPILLNLFNRGIDFAFAAVMLRMLGPADSGLYQYAVVVFVWFDIFTNFGLNTFLTREVSRDRTRAGYYFFVTSAMRLGLIIIGIIPLVLFLGARQALVSPPLDSQALLALGLLYIGLLPNSLSTGMTALFYAFEKAEYPSAVATIATINKAVCGLLVLVLGFGIMGLAAVSIFTNIITFIALLYGGRQLIVSSTSEAQPAAYRNFSLMRKMAGESWPLMLNHFLATIFFQVDIILIEAFHGSTMVGQYGVAYKWLTALNVIPSFFTMAMLPGMSRLAQQDKAALKRTYMLAVKLLFMTALPLAVIFTFLAYVLTTLLGGAEYLPDGAIATQLMIWSIPIGWINSLTQYVLIALDIQRRITRAFIIAVTFNIVTNLLLIPTFGYRAAALTTIASELMLLVPFALLLHSAMGRVNWLEIIWRPQ
jgi:O-antigen/teichoic acid export membrane protein